MAPEPRDPGSSSTGPMTQSPQQHEGTEKANKSNEEMRECPRLDTAPVGLNSGQNPPNIQEMTWLPGDEGYEASLQRHNAAWKATLEKGEAYDDVRES
eukprot:912530-Prorocentrum_lima.AAC.1